MYYTNPEAAALLHQNIDAASKMLDRLARSGLLVKIRRGLWTLPQTDPFKISGFLTSPFQSYASLQSALYFHGMIFQIPEVIYVVSLVLISKKRGG